MAGNTRGKLKESLEGVHNNYNWVLRHLDRALDLIREHNPKLTKGLKSLAKITKELDKLAQDIYGKL